MSNPQFKRLPREVGAFSRLKKLTLAPIFEKQQIALVLLIGIIFVAKRSLGILRLDIRDAASLPLNRKVNSGIAMARTVRGLLPDIRIRPHLIWHLVTAYAGSKGYVRFPNIGMVGEVVFLVAPLFTELHRCLCWFGFGFSVWNFDLPRVCTTTDIPGTVHRHDILLPASMAALKQISHSVPNN